METFFKLDPGLLQSRNKQGLTPLFMALDHGRGDMALWLIEKGANVKIKGYRGRSMLHMAARAANPEVTGRLVRMGLDVNGKDADGVTPLYLLCRGNNDNTQTAKLLIENGANVNLKSKKGFTPLANAVLRGHKKITRLLVEKGADVNAGGLGVSAKENKKKRKMFRPTNEVLLIEVIIWGDTDLTRLFIQKGADVNAPDQKGKSPLFYARKFKRKEIIDLLLTKGAK